MDSSIPKIGNRFNTPFSQTGNTLFVCKAYPKTNIIGDFIHPQKQYTQRRSFTMKLRRYFFSIAILPLILRLWWYMQNKAATPLAAGGGRSIYALFVHVRFGIAEKFARTIKSCFFVS